MAVGEIVHSGAVGMCPHGGQLTIAVTAPRVKVAGQPAAVQGDSTIAGCPFQIPIGTGTKPQPCVTCKWTVAATRVKSGGQPLLLKTNASSAICQSAEQIPAGPPSLTVVQPRVKGT